MSRTIAIVKLIESIHYDEYDSYTEIVAGGITDWEEVDDERYKLLCKAAKAAKDYSWDTQFEVIERLKNDSVEIVNTVDQYIAMVNEKEAKAKAAKAAREAKAAKTRQAKLMKDKESRKRLLAELQAEFAPTATK